MNWYKKAQQNIQLSQSGIQNLINQGDFNGLQKFLYDAITINVPSSKKAVENFSTPEYQTKIKMYRSVAESAPKSNPSWSQWDIAKHYPQENKNDMKLYRTPLDEDLEKVLYGLRSLHMELQPISQQYQTNIDFKIPSTLGGFFQHNDRLVVHFSKQEATDAIAQAVDGWASNNGITFSSRTHGTGQDVDGQSYGQRVSTQIAQQVGQHAQTGQWNSEQLTRWTINAFIGILKDVRMN